MNGRSSLTTCTTVLPVAQPCVSTVGVNDLKPEFVEATCAERASAPTC